MGEESERSLLGADVTLRHRPLVPGLYEGFTLAGEWFVNRQDFHDVGEMTARGGYAYANWDFNPELPGKWSLGLLLDSAPDPEHPLRRDAEPFAVHFVVAQRVQPAASAVHPWLG